jgi:hypothetical protein
MQDIFNGSKRLNDGDLARDACSVPLDSCSAFVRWSAPPTPPVAVHAAAAQLGIEGVEDLAVELARRQRAEDRPHVAPG